MGFDISGLLVNKNFENNLSELETIIGEELIFEEEVSFEEASENWKEEDYCDIYYSEKGTLIFLAMERGGFEFYANGNDTFSFVLSEMTMTFSINYVKNGKLIRSLVESEDNLLENEGDLLEFEKSEEDKSELIYYLFEKVLGESFYDIDLEAKCYRYRFFSNENIEKEICTPNVNSESTKRWWEFWK